MSAELTSVFDEYREGEYVRVTVEGPISYMTDDFGGEIRIGEKRVTIPTYGLEGVTIERVAPAEWPPRKNDVWRDRHGELLIGAVWAAEGPVLRSVDGSDYDTSYALRELAPLTLIHREQQDGGAS